jgi:hypothetical protein
MSDVAFVVAPLDAEHDRMVFNSGSEPLDRYLQEQATTSIVAWPPVSLHSAVPASRVITLWRPQA